MNINDYSKIMGLEGWKITLHEGCIPSDFKDGAEVTGEVEYNEVCRAAVIRLLRPDCYSDDRAKPYDMEHTLFHELLHIKLALLDNSGNALQDRIVHQIVDELADAFVRYRDYLAERGGEAPRA